MICDPVPNSTSSLMTVFPEMFTLGYRVTKSPMRASCPTVQSRLMITCFPIVMSTVKMAPAQIIVPSPIAIRSERMTLGSTSVANCTPCEADTRSTTSLLRFAVPIAQTNHESLLSTYPWHLPRTGYPPTSVPCFASVSSRKPKIFHVGDTVLIRSTSQASSRPNPPAPIMMRFLTKFSPKVSSVTFRLPRHFVHWPVVFLRGIFAANDPEAGLGAGRPVGREVHIVPVLNTSRERLFPRERVLAGG